MKILKYIFIISFLCMAGCVSEFNANLPSEDENLLVVSGNICSDSTVEINLSYSSSLSEMPSTEIPGGSSSSSSHWGPEDVQEVKAEVAMVGSDGSRIEATRFSGRGRFSLKVGTLNPEVAYGLEIIVEGEVYRSALSKPLYTQVIEKLTWQQPVEEGDVSICVSTTAGGEVNYYIWSFQEDWVINRGLLKDCWGHDAIRDQVFVSSASFQNGEVRNYPMYNIAAYDRKFSSLYRVKVTQRLISKEAYEYRRMVKKLSSEMGGLFTPQPSEIKGNITCISSPGKKAIGFVEVVGNVSTATLYIASNDIVRPEIDEFCSIIAPEIIKDMGYSDLDLIRMGYLPWPDGMGAWIEAGCISCEVNGGDGIKPDDWIK